MGAECIQGNQTTKGEVMEKPEIKHPWIDPDKELPGPEYVLIAFVARSGSYYVTEAHAAISDASGLAWKGTDGNRYDDLPGGAYVVAWRPMPVFSNGKVSEMSYPISIEGYAEAAKALWERRQQRGK